MKNCAGSFSGSAMSLLSQTARTASLLLLLLAGCIFLHAQSPGLLKKQVSISFKEETVKTVLEKLQAETGIPFVYNPEEAGRYKTPARDFKQAPIQDILKAMLVNSNLVFEETNGYVIIRTGKKPANPKKQTVIPGSFTGKVMDEESGEPVAGATIRSGTHITITDQDGLFAVVLPKGSHTAAITSIGYENKELTGIEINGDSLVIREILLKKEKGQLNEVVVLGFGQTQKKMAQTGAIASITSKEIKQSPVANIANALAGRLPGLITVQRSGDPGRDMPEMYIRGRATSNDTDPLITIDGVQKDATSLSVLDPNEIENITILKDASATALYGVKGANGVIIVKTRRGKEGRPAISASLQRSIQSATRMPQFLDSYNLALLANEAYYNDNPTGILPPYKEEAIQAYKTNSDPYKYPNVDWIDEMIKPSQMTRANFNISGGSRMAKYFVNVGYTQQDGLYKSEKQPQYDPNTIYKRYNFRSNIDIDFDENFSIGLNLTGAIEDRNQSASSTYDVFNYLFKTPPTYSPIKYPTGYYGGEVRGNPFALLNTTGYVQSFNSFLSGMLTATRKLDFITRGLYLKGSYSFDGAFRNDLRRTRQARTAKYNGVGDINDTASYTYVSSDLPLSAPSPAYDQSRTIWMDASLNYEQSFKDHHVTGMLLANRTQYLAGGTAASAEKLIPFVTQGLVSRITYNYRNKYFAEFNAGYNGTDNFAKNNRYGFFPAVSVGWVLTQEKFLKGNPVLDFLKVRASYGLTGNDRLNSGRRWLFVSQYNTAGGYSYGENLQGIGGRMEGAMANEQVTWEKAYKTNIGLEVKLWNGLLGITTDLFREKRKDILIVRGSVPAIIGVSSANLPPANMGEILNQGFEVEISHRQRLGKVNYFVNANGSYAKNKIRFMDEVDRRYDYLKRTGTALGQFFGLTSIGFFQNQEEITKSPKQFGTVIPGDLKYKDLNGDNVIDALDEGPIGRTNVPEFLYGISAGISIQRFDLSVLFQGAANYNILFSHEGAWEFYNQASALEQHLGRWTPQTAATATYPALHYNSNVNNWRTSSFFLKDASYIRLKNIEVGYSFRNVAITKKAILSSVRVYANGMNLITWDKMGNNYFDPEAPSGKGFYYPQLKVFNIGVSTDF
jgi:TonB-linked SusC/RagA family outer membrane protein